MPGLSVWISVAAVFISLLSAYYTWQRVVIERQREAYRRRQENTARLHALYQPAPEGYIVLVANYGEAAACDVVVTCRSRSNGELRWTDQIPVIGPRSTFHSEHHWNHARDDLVVRLVWNDPLQTGNVYETTL